LEFIWDLEIGIWDFRLPNYLYTTKSLDGQTQKGTREAASEAELARIFREEGLILVSAQLAQSPLKATKKFAGFFSFRRVSLVEKMMFAEHLAVMIGAGLSLTRALEALSTQTKNRLFAQTIVQLNEEIKKGSALADSLACHPKIFSNLFVNMVKVGEASGNLEKVLKILARQMKKDHELISKVKSAMIYPAIIIGAVFVVGALMMILVVPKLTQIFRDMRTELPYSTKLIIAISDFLSQHWLWSLLIVLAVILGLRAIARTKAGKSFFDWLILKMPVFGEISKKINSGRLALTLGSLIESGVPIVQGLEIVSGTLSNGNFSRSLKEAAGAIQKGEPLAQSLKKYPHLYPAMVDQMVEVGEETGTLGEILNKLADFYEEEVTNVTQGLTAIIEPILMIIIGVVVGFFAISMIQPMYSIMEGM
jgi:type IV pilus assembly protein PilC